MRLSPIAFLACAPAAFSQSLDYSFDTGSSNLTLDATLVLELGGDLRGAFDAKSNPGGTRTIAGLVGDPGSNADIPVSLDLEFDVDLGGALQGGFELDLHDAALPLPGAPLGATVRGLGADLVPSGGGAGAGLTLVLEYDTFRTAAPQSLFIGGFPLPLPLGSLDVTGARIEQSAPIAAILLPTAAGSYELTSLVPIELSFDVSLGGILGGGGGGAATPVGPIPLVLPLNATVDLADCAAALEAAPDAITINESGPSPIDFDLPEIPLDLPTILPPGGTANLLIDAALSGFTLDGTLSSQISAEASAASRFIDVCAGDANSMGPGATLEPLGSPSLGGMIPETSAPGTSAVGASGFGLRVSGLPAEQFGILVMSRTTDTIPCLDPAQGTVCLGEPCFRFTEDVRLSSLTGDVTFFPNTAALPQGQSFLPGERWNFQWWYRDRNPAPTSNLSAALGVRFCR